MVESVTINVNVWCRERVRRESVLRENVMKILSISFLFFFFAQQYTPIIYDYENWNLTRAQKNGFINLMVITNKFHGR